MTIFPNMLSPPSPANDLEFRFSDLIDVSAFSHMLESFFLATGIPNGLVDADGTLLSMSSGNNACVAFHRMHPRAEECCKESNLAIMHDLRNGQIAGGLCKNGLMDYATPVIIEGRHLATLFLGQVLHRPPDMAFFQAQAKRFGFDEKAYLASIAAIPVIEKSHAEALMKVMVDMAQMLASSGLARIRQIKLEHDLSLYAERRIQLEDILNFSPVGIGWSNSDGSIEYINRHFTEMFGYTLEDLPDLGTWYQLAYPDAQYRESVIQPWIKRVAHARKVGTSPPELEADITCKNGTVRRVVLCVSWVGQRRLVNFTDITERWVGEQRRQAHDAMLEMVARGNDLTEILDAIVRQAESEDKTSLCSILLLDAEGKHLVSGAAPSLPDFYNQAINGVAIGIGVGSCGTAAYLGQRVVVEDIMAHEYWKPYAALAEQAGLRACWSEPIFSSRGRVLGTFAIYHTEPIGPQLEDIERIGFAANLAAIAIENRHTHEELERRAYSDSLTGLANRRHFLELSETELARALRYGGKLSILMMDIDHFKQVNDTYGHKVGDLVLKKLAEISLSTLRDIDTIGRIGGEEFAVMLPETTGAQAMEAAERLRNALFAARLALDGGLPLQFTVSLGVTTLSDKETNIDTLLNQADQALYQAKNEGRNRVCRYEGDSSAEA